MDKFHPGLTDTGSVLSSANELQCCEASKELLLFLFSLKELSFRTATTDKVTVSKEKEREIDRERDVMQERTDELALARLRHCSFKHSCAI